MGNEKSETFEIISLTDTIHTAKMQYFNSKGESGIMTSKLTNNDFHMNGDRIKFIGTINDKNSEVVGKWFLQADDKSWAKFIDLKLEKLN